MSKYLSPSLSTYTQTCTTHTTLFKAIVYHPCAHSLCLLPLFFLCVYRQCHTCTGLYRDPQMVVTQYLGLASFTTLYSHDRQPGIKPDSSGSAPLVQVILHSANKTHQTIWSGTQAAETIANLPTIMHSFPSYTQLYNPDHSSVTWSHLTDRRASSLQPQPEIG